MVDTSKSISTHFQMKHMLCLEVWYAVLNTLLYTVQTIHQINSTPRLKPDWVDVMNSFQEEVQVLYGSMMSTEYHLSILGYCGLRNYRIDEILSKQHLP